MKKFLVFILLLGFALAGPIQYFKVKGIRGAVVPRKDIDSVVVYIMVRGGSAYDPAGKEGVSDLLTNLLVKGTEKYTAEEFSKRIETMGSEIDAYTDDEAIFIYGWSLKEHFGKTFSLVADALLHPAFREKEIAKEKKRLITSLAQKWDQPAYIASEFFKAKLLEGSPFGREETPETVKKITREDLLAYHRRFFNKKNIFVVIAGNIEPSEAKGMVEKYLSSLPKGKKASPLPLMVKTKTKVYIVDRPQAPQTQIRMGYVSLPFRSLKEMAARRLANYILGGGGFSSRMMKIIRAKEGLTYGIYSYFSGFVRGDYFEITTFTKNETVGKAVDLTLKLVREFHEKGATQEELEKAKGYYLGGYPLRLETPLDFAYRILIAELYGYGKKYVYWEKNFVPSVRLKDVNRAARKYFYPEPMLIVCVGPANKIKAQLEKFGPVEVVQPPKF